MSNEQYKPLTPRGKAHHDWQAEGVYLNPYPYDGVEYHEYLNEFQKLTMREQESEHSGY